MVSTYDVYVKISTYSREAEKTTSLLEAIELTNNKLLSTFKNAPKSIVRATSGDMGGYEVVVTFGFALRGIDISDAAKRAFEVLLKELGHRPDTFEIRSHIYGESNLNEIEQEFRLH